MSLSNEEWDAYGELVKAESEAYHEMLEQRSPTVGRVYPTKVAAATDRWHGALETRMRATKALAAQLQVPTPKVMMLYAAHRYERSKEAKKK